MTARITNRKEKHFLRGEGQRSINLWNNLWNTKVIAIKFGKDINLRNPRKFVAVGKNTCFCEFQLHLEVLTVEGIDLQSDHIQPSITRTVFFFINWYFADLRPLVLLNTSSSNLDFSFFFQSIQWVLNFRSHFAWLNSQSTFNYSMFSW